MKRYHIIHVKFATKLWVIYKLKRIDAKTELNCVRAFKRWANKEYGKGNYGIVKIVFYGEASHD